MQFILTGRNIRFDNGSDAFTLAQLLCSNLPQPSTSDDRAIEHASLQEDFGASQTPKDVDIPRPIVLQAPTEKHQHEGTYLHARQVASREDTVPPTNGTTQAAHIKMQAILPGYEEPNFATLFADTRS